MGREGVEEVELSGGVRFEIPSDASYVSLARMLVSTLAYARRDLDDERIQDLVLAVSEAATSVIEAERRERGQQPTPVVLLWRDSDDDCTVDIVARHAALDIEALPPEGTPADPGRAAIEGDLGIPLIRALVDDVDFTSNGDGTSVSMRMICGRALVVEP